MTPWTFCCPICLTELSEENAGYNTDYTQSPEVRCDCGASSVWPNDGAEVNGHVIGLRGTTVALESRCDMELQISVDHQKLDLDQEDLEAKSRLVAEVFRAMSVRSIMEI